MKTIELTQKELDNLGEYSISLPTRTTIGKRWKANKNWGRVVQYPCGDGMRTDPAPPRWVVGEYVDSPKANMVGILWYEVIIIGD